MSSRLRPILTTFVALAGVIVIGACGDGLLVSDRLVGYVQGRVLPKSGVVDANEIVMGA